MKKISTLIITLTTVCISFANTARYRLVITDNPATTITIAWDQVSGTNSVVYYGTTDEGANFASYPLHKNVERTVSYRGMNNSFVKLNGLAANTNYYFVVKDSEGVSARFWFRTAPDQNVPMSFIAGGDSRNNRVPRVNANKLVSKIKPTAVFFGGDMTNADTNSDWIEWMDDWQNTTASDGRMFPIVPARGNHEGSNRSIYDLFNTPSTDVYYDITFGENLYTIFTLNSEIAEGGNQYAWLSDTVDTDNSLWKSAQYHKPMRPHTSGKSEGNGEYSNWAQLFYDEGFSLVFESDSHMVKATYPVKPCSSGSNCDEGFEIDDTKGTVYVGEGCWGAPLRGVNDSKTWTRDAGSFNQFKYVVVSETQIKLKTIKVDNAASVGENSNDETPGTLPSDINVWQASNGSEILINRSGVSDKTISLIATTDVEQRTDGSVSESSSDLELVFDTEGPGGDQVIGIEFAGITIPKGSTITSAYVQFHAKSDGAEPATFKVSLEDSENPMALGSSSNEVTGRSFLAGIDWSPEAWTAGSVGTAEQTSDISGQLQAIVDKAGWASGNAVVIKIEAIADFLGKGTLRRAFSNKDTSKAPVLKVGYVTGPNANPTATITSPDNNTHILAGSVSIDATASDTDGTIESVTFYIDDVEVNVDTTAPYSYDYSFTDGNHSVKVIATDDQGGTDVAKITILVGTVQGETTILASNDVEEKKDVVGTIKDNSSDLELVYDTEVIADDQIIGIEFSSVDVPKNAIINNAYIQFKAKDSGSDAVSYSVSFENSDNATAIDANNGFDVSSRTYLTPLTWSPLAWSKGEDSENEQLEGLESQINEVVGKVDWVSGNRMVLKIEVAPEFSGKQKKFRNARSINGGYAPQLHIKYTVNPPYLSLDKNLLNNQIKVYPVPVEAGGVLHIESESSKNLKVQILDVSGSVIYESVNDKEIWIPRTLHGVYFIKVISGSAVFTKEILIK